MTISVHVVAAARPNFMKVAPLFHALNKADWCTPMLIHTGQHYDANMSDCFLEGLGLPKPHVHLNVGSGSHAEQTGKVMIEYEKVLMHSQPDVVIVVGDVNSTMACAIAASKLDIPVAHLEAGLRSRDRSMPEEINRLLTDAIADLLWPPSQDGVDNLLQEGVPAHRIELVGNIMIDSFEMMRAKIVDRDKPGELGLPRGSYGVVTMHRPSNVDVYDRLECIVESLVGIAESTRLAFPMHPRTAAKLEEFGLMHRIESAKGIVTLPPLDYVNFMSLVVDSAAVITDSGGIQEETTYLGIPCLTLRDNTERPVTVEFGTNQLLSPGDLSKAFREATNNPPRKSVIPFWDGNTAERVVDSLKRFVTSQ